MQTAFTPLESLGGGVLIGLSAVMLMAILGRVAGISGITQQALWPSSGAAGDRGWRLAFLLGLLAAPLAIMAAGGAVTQAVSANLPVMAIAGLLVGTGAALGSGCTSGHGVCGLARLSVRSGVAVASFMTAGFVTVFVLRHIAGGL